MAHGATYTVTVGTQPTDLKYCQVTNSTGTATAAVSNVTVSCAYETWVMTEMANSTTAFAADPILDPTNAANHIVRTIGTAKPLLGYFDINGNYYFTAINSQNKIFRISNNGTKSSYLVPGLSSIASITGDNQGNVYFIDRNSIVRVSSNGNTNIVCTGFSNNYGTLSGFVYDNIQNIFYIADRGYYEVSSLDPSNCSKTNLGSPLNEPSTVSLDFSNNLFVSYVAQNTGIRQVNKVTGVASTPLLSSDLIASLYSIFVFDASNNLYYSPITKDAVALDSSGVIRTLRKNISTLATSQRGIGINSNGEVYITVFDDKKIIKLSRP
jgi:streptogramin lyase